MSGTVLQGNEVLLNSKRYSIQGGVSKTNVTPFAHKFTLGDYSRENKTVDSSFVLSDFSGGLGILEPTYPRDQDRFWFSNLETRYRHLVLGTYRTQFDSAFADNDNIIAIHIHDEKLFVVAGTNYDMYIADVATDEVLDDTMLNLDGVPTGWASYGGDLFVSTANSLYQYDGTTWTTFDGSVTLEYPGGYAMCVWDDKLFVLDLTNTLRWTINPTDNITTDWTVVGQLHLPTGYCGQMLPFFDQLGTRAIHAITKVGIFAYDFASATWYDTPVTWPTTSDAGTGACVWRGELYVPVGQNAYLYNGSTVRNIAIARDDGLPATHRGPITKIVPGHAFYYALMNNTVAGAAATENLFSDYVWDDLVFTPNSAIGAIFVSPGQSWHVLEAMNTGVGVIDATVGSVEGTYRFWFAGSDGLYYYELADSLHNPLQNPSSEYRDTGYLETGWIDMGWAELDKLALDFDVEARNCDTDHPIRFFIAWDEVDTWEPVGTVTSNGQTTFQVGGLPGKLFRTMRIRVEMDRGDDITLTPELRSAVVGFHRTPDPHHSYQFLLQMTDKKLGRTARQQLDEIEALVEHKYAIPFVYVDDQTGETETKWVRVSRSVGTESTGMTRQGRYTINLTEVRG